MNLLSLFTSREKSPLPVLRDGGRHFWVRGGRTLASLGDLADVLKDMSYEIFEHHVYDGKNDFSAWVRDALGESELADKIEHFRTARNIRKAVMAHITRHYLQ